MLANRHNVDPLIGFTIDEHRPKLELHHQYRVGVSSKLFNLSDHMFDIQIEGGRLQRIALSLEAAVPRRSAPSP